MFRRLLIWEDCYYEPVLCSAETSSSRSCVLAGDNAQLLVSKMMMDNHVNIVGEGYGYLNYCLLYFSANKYSQPYSSYFSNNFSQVSWESCFYWKLSMDAIWQLFYRNSSTWGIMLYSLYVKFSSLHKSRGNQVKCIVYMVMNGSPNICMRKTDNLRSSILARD